MATVRDLKRSARDALTPFMASHGFSEGHRLIYWRATKEGVLHVVSITPIVGGKQARVWAFCVVPEIVPDFDESTFDRQGLPIVVGGMVSDRGIGSDYAAAHIEPAERRSAFLGLVCNHIRDFALPFFAGIETRSQFWDALDEDDKTHYERIGKKNAILRS